MDDGVLRKGACGGIGDGLPIVDVVDASLDGYAGADSGAPGGDYPMKEVGHPGDCADGGGVSAHQR